MFMSQQYEYSGRWQFTLLAVSLEVLDEVARRRKSVTCFLILLSPKFAGSDPVDFFY